MALLQNRNIVIVGLQPWDTEIGSNCKNIALEFSKHNRVLYVNSPLDRITKIRGKAESVIQKRISIANSGENLIPMKSNLWVFYPDVVIESINWIKNGMIFDLLNKMNNKKFSRSITKAIVQLGFEDIILFNDNDIFRSFYLKEYLNPTISLYYSRDYLLGVDYWRYHGSRLEPLLMAKSDICVANSNYLTSLSEKYNNHSYYVGQGCELELFLDPTSHIPEDMEGIPQPIVGYVGVLQTLRLDINIISHIASKRPEWSIVLVGPEDEDFKKSELHLANNIYFLGSKVPDDLPAYVNTFTVCINPQVVNDVTRGNYPRKIDEYLAAGKPVVATDTETMRDFIGYCWLAKSKEEYVEFIELAIEENSGDFVEHRKAFAASHSWENSVGKIYESILLNSL